MAEEKLKLTTYLSLCLAFEQEPTEENDLAIDTFLSNLQIKSYMPLTQKIMTVIKILSRISDDLDEAGTAGYVEMGRVMTGLLSYCVNLENDCDRFGSLYVVYDAIMEHGLYSEIFDVCEEDFDRLTLMLRDAINIAHIEKLTSTAALFNEQEYDKWTKLMGNIKTTLTPELLSDLMAVNAQNAPEDNGLLQALTDKAVSEVMTELHAQGITEKALEETLHKETMPVEKEAEITEDDADDLLDDSDEDTDGGVN